MSAVAVTEIKKNREKFLQMVKNFFDGIQKSKNISNDIKTYTDEVTTFFTDSSEEFVQELKTLDELYQDAVKENKNIKQELKEKTLELEKTDETNKELNERLEKKIDGIVVLEALVQILDQTPDVFLRKKIESLVDYVKFSVDIPKTPESIVLRIV